MNFEDDPKLTAYALGELESAEDRAACAALLREHPELEKELEETRSIAALLRRELHAEPAAPLREEQRAEVLAAQAGAGEVPAAEQPSAWLQRRWIPAAIAACVAVVSGVAIYLPRRDADEQAKELALGLPQSVVQTAPSPEPRAAERATAGKAMAENATLSDADNAPATSVADQPLPALGRSELGAPAEPASAAAAAASPSRGVTLIPQPAPAGDRADLAKGQVPFNLPTVSTAPGEGTELLAGINQPPPATQTPAPAAPAAKAAADRSFKGTSIAGALQIEAEQLADRNETAVAYGRSGSVFAGGGTMGEAPPPQRPDSAGKPAALAASEGVAPGRGRAKLQIATASEGVYYDEAESRERIVARARTLVRDMDAVRDPIAPGAPDQIYRKLEEPQLLQKQRQQTEASNTEAYDTVTDNPFLLAKENALSTFSIDVDTASYANVRRFLTSGQRPPKGAVRIEELINYFRYDYPQPQGDDPFSCTLEVAAAPWAPAHRLVRVGLKGREIAKDKRPASNLVFLLDVSGSMDQPNKLPLVKQCMKQLVNELGEKDTVAIAVYAGASGTVLEPTSDKEEIFDALERLSPGGSTNGASGIRLAYDLAQRSFKKGGNNRVLLCTDGDFNVGVTNQSQLTDLIAKKAKSGVFLSVLGFGMGNLKDSTMEKLADKGNGNYAYIDSLKEGRKVLVEEMSGTLFTIAKDVKIQVEWNPALVGAYRLIGYENRLLAKEDFNDDTKDAGEIGAGHTVTALYEVVPAGTPLPTMPGVDALKYQTTGAAPVPASRPEEVQPAGSVSAGTPVLGRVNTAAVEASKEMLTLKLRFKAPEGDASTLRTFPLSDSGATWDASSPDFRWAAAVASFGMLLRDSPHHGNASWASTLELAAAGKGNDPSGYRQEFIGLVQKASELVPLSAASTSDTTELRPKIVPQTKAAKLMLPEFSATDSPLLDVIDALAKKSREVDAEKSGVQVVYAGPSSGSQTRLTLRLNNVSVADAARAIASAANVTLAEEGDTLILRGR